MIAEESANEKYDSIIVAPNAAVDSYYFLNSLDLHEVNRATNVLHTAGGKGNNMARAMKQLGGVPLSIGLAGGPTGKIVLDGLASEDIQFDYVHCTASTRQCVTILDQDEGDATIVLDPGIETSFDVEGELSELVWRHRKDSDYLALVGSYPPGFSDNFFAELVKRLASCKVQTCIDAHGEKLKLAVKAGVQIVKINRSEFLNTFFMGLDNLEIKTAQNWLDEHKAFGLETLIITDGAHGALVLSSKDEPFRVKTQVSEYVSSAGAGDTFFAGLLLALSQNRTIREAARFASAAAAANLKTYGCGFLEIASVEKLLEETELEMVV